MKGEGCARDRYGGARCGGARCVRSGDERALQNVRPERGERIVAHARPRTSALKLLYITKLLLQILAVTIL